MHRSPRRTAALALAVIAIVSCSSSDDSDATIAPPVDSAPAANPVNGTPATFGVGAALGDLKLTVSDPVIESDEDGPWLSLTVRADNRTQIDVQSPQFELRCSGSSRGGTWMETSTFVQGDPVPPLSFNEGTAKLLVPGDERLGDPRLTCEKPATVVASLLVFDNAGASAPKEKKVGWAVPDELIDQLNAAPQPG